MQKHMSNGLAVARFLETHPMVLSVNHPGICLYYYFVIIVMFQKVLRAIKHFYYHKIII
jgi:hypothetical protein